MSEKCTDDMKSSMCRNQRSPSVNIIPFQFSHSSSTFRTHESRILGSGDSDKHLDDFLPEYLRPPKDPFEVNCWLTKLFISILNTPALTQDEPRFADTTNLPNYLGNPNSIYRLRPHKSGSYGSSETSTGSSSSSNHYNGYFKNSGTSTDKITDVDQSAKNTEEKVCHQNVATVSQDERRMNYHFQTTKEKSAAEEQPLDPLNPVYSTEYVGYSTTSDVSDFAERNLLDEIQYLFVSGQLKRR